MGWYVHVSVVFPVAEPEQVKAIAAELHPKLAGQSCLEVDVFLDDLRLGQCITSSRKGWVCAWGATGNYTNGDEFVGTLRPFWTALYQDRPDQHVTAKPGDVAETVFTHNNILVFIEQEQSGAASAYQIEWDDKAKGVTWKRFDELPFSWGM